MSIVDRNIEIMFSVPSPEQIITNVIKRYFENKNCSGDLFAFFNKVGKEFYYNSMRKLSKNYSYEETINMFSLMENQMSMNSVLPKSIFQLLVLFSKDVLEIKHGTPVCHLSDFARWRELSFKLGQDVFTTSYMAYRNVLNHVDIKCFDWPAMISCDDVKLNSILSKGISENHFHLTGSTRLFELSWICMMNHPDKIHDFFYQDNVLKKLLIVNRSPVISYDVSENKLKWDELIRYAVFIRKELFKSVINGCSISIKDFVLFENSLQKNLEVNREITTIRLFYGDNFKQPNGNRSCLDYAILNYVNTNSHNRVLTGERKLMYDCFVRCFSDKFNSFTQNLFYIYLLIKKSFRNELIQVNEETGFFNFSTYQDRKSIFWKSLTEYKVEAQKLAINASMESGNIKSLEIRIAPENSPLDNYKQIKDEDIFIQFSENNEYKWSHKQNSVELPFFYVYHFIKKKITNKPKRMSLDRTGSRNDDVRHEIKKQAIALAKALERSPYLCSRVRGIDAASFEVGCRPETFATEFRFLRNYTPYHNNEGLFNESVEPRISASYHVGEDFLDIVDGLRAIDEAITFAELKRGDRIGHAIALGVDAATHYKLKKYQIIMPKQDMLDNTVWLLNRIKEFGIIIPSDLESKLMHLYDELFNDIYGRSSSLKLFNTNNITYYNSWKLRGDLPECYLFSRFDDLENAKGFKHIKCPAAMQYYNYSVRHFENESLYRSNPNIILLMTLYHFGYEERKRGLEVKMINVEESFVDVVTQIQEKMQSIICNKGIGIECNLTSNVLIGTFKKYSKHPIFNLNNHLISSEDDKHLFVSLNTDDQGVFDTSLENEYVLLFSHMAKMKKDGKRIYSDDKIYEYLDYLRELGNLQVFPPVEDLNTTQRRGSELSRYIESLK